MIFKWVLFDDFHSMLLQDLDKKVCGCSTIPFKVLKAEKRVEKGKMPNNL